MSRSSPVRRYTDEIHDGLGYWATWLPTESIRLGDCGPVRDRVFKVEATLEDFGVDFRKAPAASPGNHLVHSSGKGVSWDFQTKAGLAQIQPLPPGKAGVAVRFSREHAVVAVVREPRTRRVDNIHELNRTLLGLAQAGDFPQHYAVVTTVVEAAAASVLISSSAEGLFAASAEADLTAGIVDLANAELSLQRVSSRDLTTEIVAERGLTPLFGLAGFKKGGLFRGKPDFKGLAFDEDPNPGVLADLAPGDTDPD